MTKKKSVAKVDLTKKINTIPEPLELDLEAGNGNGIAYSLEEIAGFEAGEAEFFASTPASLIAEKSASSEATRVSWLNPATRAGRLERRTIFVSVNGSKAVEFSSAPKAFTAYGLSNSRMLNIRSRLKKGENDISLLKEGVSYLFTNGRTVS